LPEQRPRQSRSAVATVSSAGTTRQAVIPISSLLLAAALPSSSILLVADQFQLIAW
jgi:hypothetical protein